MIAKSWRLASSENPSTSAVIWRRIRGSGVSCVFGYCIGHHLTRTSLDLGEGLQHLLALARIGNVSRDRSVQNRLYVLRTVGQGGIGTDGDALHALGAVFRDEERRDETRDILRRRITAGSGHDAYGSQRRRRLVVSVARAELGIEGRDPSDRSALCLASRRREGAASIAVVIDDRRLQAPHRARRSDLRLRACPRGSPGRVRNPASSLPCST